MIADSSGSKKAYGIYRGSVVANKDPLNKRRLRLKVPQILGSAVTEWAWPKESASTKSQPPVIGQGVWVMFEGGDTSFPIWVGTFGNHPKTDIHGLMKPVTSISGTSPYLISVKNSDGTTEIDVLKSLIKMAQKITELETRLTTEENKPDNIGSM